MLQNRIEALREARKNGENGFTLIELLIVIIVLGILAGIVVFGVGTFRQDAVAAAACADVKTVSVAADGYFAKTGAYPAGATDADRIGVLVTAKYLKDTPANVTLSTTGVTATTVTGVTC